MDNATETSFQPINFIFSLGNEAYEGFQTFTWLIVVAFNAYFILSWAYLLMLSLGWKHPKFLWLITIVGCIVCKRRVVKNEVKQSDFTEQIPAVATLKEVTPKKRVFGKKSARKRVRKRKSNRKALSKKKKYKRSKINQPKAPMNPTPNLDTLLQQQDLSASYRSSSRLRLPQIYRYILF